MNGEKKEMILEAAVEVMAEEGYYNTKMSWIADRAEIAVGTIYNYFGSKEEVLEEIFAREFKKRLDFLAALEDDPELTARDRIKSFLEKHFSDIKNNPSLGKILVREKEFPRKKSDAIGGYLNQLPNKLAEVLSSAHQQGQLKIDNPDLTAAALFGAIQGVVERAVKLEQYSLLDEAAEELLFFLERK